MEAEAACDIQVRDSQADLALRARRRPVLPSPARSGADRPSVPASQRGPVAETDPVQDNCPVEVDPVEETVPAVVSDLAVAIGLVLVDLVVADLVKLAPAKDPPAATGAERSTIITTITAAIMLATTTTGPTRAGETPAATGTGTERSIT